MEKSIRRRVTPSTAVPRNWHDFLRVDDNKKELFHYLSQDCSTWPTDANKKIVITDGTEVLVSPFRDTSSLVPCLHEEADTRMFVHAADAASGGHKKTIVRTVETDVKASILYKCIAGRYRPVSYPDGPITTRYTFIQNAYWGCSAGCICV